MTTQQQWGTYSVLSQGYAVCFCFIVAQQYVLSYRQEDTKS